MPQLVEINPSCQEFKRLGNDIPKYYRGSTLFNDTHKKELDEIINANSKYYNQPESVPWLLPLLTTRKSKEGTPVNINVNENLHGYAVGRRIQEFDNGVLPQVCNLLH